MLIVDLWCMQLWEKRLVRGTAQSMMVGIAQHYARTKAYRRHVASRTAMASSVQGLSKASEHTIDLTDDTNPIASLVLELEHVQSALESGTRLLHCVEYKAVKWGDYTVKDNRFFAFERDDVLCVASVLSLRQAAGEHFIFYRQYKDFEMCDSSLHVSSISLQERVEVMTFPNPSITLSRSEVVDQLTNTIHVDL